MPVMFETFPFTGTSCLVDTSCSVARLGNDELTSACSLTNDMGTGSIVPLFWIIILLIPSFTVDGTL